MNNAKIIAITSPTLKLSRDNNDGTFSLMGVDDFIAYVARVSNPSNQNNTLTAPKLLRYLAKHKHWSPFEMVNVVMEINTTRDIARQILRHRSFSFQEFSQRYADPTQDLGFVTREARLQDTKNRQNSIETDEGLSQSNLVLLKNFSIFSNNDLFSNLDELTVSYKNTQNLDYEFHVIRTGGYRPMKIYCYQNNMEYL